MPLMEAMACGLPSIATDWGAHEEFCRRGNRLSAARSRDRPGGRQVPLLRRLSLGRPGRRPPAAPAARGLRETRGGETQGLRAACDDARALDLAPRGASHRERPPGRLNGPPPTLGSPAIVALVALAHPAPLASLIGAECHVQRRRSGRRVGGEALVRGRTDVVQLGRHLLRRRRRGARAASGARFSASRRRRFELGVRS